MLPLKQWIVTEGFRIKMNFASSFFLNLRRAADNMCIKVVEDKNVIKIAVESWLTLIPVNRRVGNNVKLLIHRRFFYLRNNFNGLLSEALLI